MDSVTENSIRIWVDADACPAVIKEILFKTSRRLKVQLTLVANLTMRVPQSEIIEVITVTHGADIADDMIVDRMQPGDIVITGDIPLAARVVEKGGVAIGTRGQMYDAHSVQGRLASRNLMEQLRSSGVQTSGPTPLGKKDVQTFANALDRTLTKRLSREKSD